MNLNLRIDAALAEAAASPHSETVQRIVIPCEPGRIELQLTVVGSAGVLCHGIDHDLGRPCASVTDLRAWADRVAATVTYLTERLGVIEQDDEGTARCLIRSVTPYDRAIERLYFETRVDGDGRLNFRRVRYTKPAGEHVNCPFELTREVLTRLCEDLINCGQDAP
jgi:hypothetical protein